MTLRGDYSYVIGRKANIDAAHPGTFLFADSTFADFNSVAANEFAVRASGGATFYTNGGLTAGVTIGPGSGGWSSVSARAAKENFESIDPLKILEEVVAMPVEIWNYKSQEDSIRHIGPMAEDFSSAFGVGDFEGRITSTDADGVALAAIQGLNQKLEAKQAEIEHLNAKLDAYDELLATVQQRLTTPESKSQ